MLIKHPLSPIQFPWAHFIQIWLFHSRKQLDFAENATPGTAEKKPHGLGNRDVHLDVPQLDDAKWGEELVVTVWSGRAWLKNVPCGNAKMSFW